MKLKDAYNYLKNKDKSITADARRHLTGFFGEMPNLVVVQEEPSSRATIRADIQFRLSRGDQEAVLLIETKTSAEPRIVANWIDRLAEPQNRPEGHYPILCAPYISTAASEMLKSHRIGYIDLSGNCWLDLGFLIVERSGRPNRFKAPKEQQTLFAARASRIVRILLENPAKDWTLQELAKTAGVSLGLVHRVTKALEEGLFAEKRRSRFTLQDPGALLDAWRSFYVGRRIRWERYYWPVGQDVRAGMQEIAKCARAVEVRYAFTGPAAASLLGPYLMVSGIHCYLSALKPGLLDALRADPIPSGGNLWFNVIQKEDIFVGSHQIEDLYVVSDIQMYLDLFALGGRGKEAAETLRERRLRF
jgi:AraC-like DNA-binding protein